MVDEKKKKELHFRLEPEAEDELEKAKAWFGYYTDEEVTNKAFGLFFHCRAIEEDGHKLCVWDPKTGSLEIINLHKKTSEQSEDEEKIEDEDVQDNGKEKLIN